jgi:hypothetical protein
MFPDWGGQQAHKLLAHFAQFFGTIASMQDSIAASAGLEAGFSRREEGWKFQKKQAEKELEEIDVQIRVADLRIEIADQAVKIHERSIDQQQEILDYFHDKFTEVGLYTWLSTNLQRLFRDAYNNAYAMAKLAEQAYRFERGDDAAELIGPNHWEASRAGLLAGERLLIDLQNLERRYLETNYRGLEIDQTFSLTQIAPDALMQLRTTGVCDFYIPEIFFDLFYPGHYRRRIKAVRLTIPCITGPYTNVSATLRLMGSRIRKEPKTGAPYLLEVPRSRSLTIATSTAQNDAGVFELNFRDERYMPFEGAGAVSTWRLSLPKNLRPFDYETINDVMLHISYTAEEGDEQFSNAIDAAVAGTEVALLDMLQENSLARVISLRQEFSNEFHRLLHGEPDTPVRIQITDRHFPFFLRNRRLDVENLVVILRTPTSTEQSIAETPISIGDVDLSINGTSVTLEQNTASDVPDEQKEWGGLPYADFRPPAVAAVFPHGIRPGTPVDIEMALALPSPTAPDVSVIDTENLTDIFLYIEYKLQA